MSVPQGEFTFYKGLVNAYCETAYLDPLKKNNPVHHRDKAVTIQMQLLVPAYMTFGDALNDDRVLKFVESNLQRLLVETPQNAEKDKVFKTIGFNASTGTLGSNRSMAETDEKDDCDLELTNAEFHDLIASVLPQRLLDFGCDPALPMVWLRNLSVVFEPRKPKVEKKRPTMTKRTSRPAMTKKTTKRAKRTQTQVESDDEDDDDDDDDEE